MTEKMHSVSEIGSPQSRCDTYGVRAVLVDLLACSRADRAVWIAVTDSGPTGLADANGREVVFSGEPGFGVSEAVSAAPVTAVLADGTRRLGRDGATHHACLPLGHDGQITGCLYLTAREALSSARLDDAEALLVARGPILAQSRLIAALERDNARLRKELDQRRASERELRESLERSKAMVRNREAELEAAQQELVRKERLATLGQLIATVSHELRNPLGTVRGSVFIISQRLLGKDLGVERALDRAERNIVRCDRIIEDLLDYTRTQDLDLQPAHLDRWLEGALEEYLFPADVSVRVQLGANIEVLIEPERLRRCLINLVNNACDAMKTKKGEEVERPKQLVVSSRVSEDRAEIRVQDTGCGIPRENLEKIFEPLFSTKSFGVGLGLPTVHQIMEQHGGGLAIESEEGKGTAATLWFPVPKSQNL